jgi:hypothetical protein
MLNDAVILLSILAIACGVAFVCATVIGARTCHRPGDTVDGLFYEKLRDRDDVTEWPCVETIGLGKSMDRR